MKELLSGLALLLLLAGQVPMLAQATDSETIIYLVRHGETEGSTLGGGSDPELNTAGQKRAQELARMLSSAGVTRVFSTNLHRTLQTAAPLAKHAGVEIEHYDPGQPDELVRKLRTELGIYLVSGHSNTTPDMVTRLGGEAGSPIQHWEYDRFYILVFKAGSGVPTTLLLRYDKVSTAP